MIMLSDLRACGHILNNHYDYEKTKIAKKGLAMLIGDGGLI